MEADARRVPTADEIMRRVRSQVLRRSGDHHISLPRWRSDVPPLTAKAQYSLGDLLAFADHEFLGTAYRVLLQAG